MRIIEPSIGRGTNHPGLDLNILFETALPSGHKIIVGRAVIRPGSRIPAVGTGAHREDEISYICKGSLTAGSGGGVYLVTAGQTTFIPAGESHWCKNNGDTDAELVYVLLPLVLGERPDSESDPPLE